MASSAQTRDFLDELADPRLVSAIDLVRWLAAAVVVFSHARFPLLKGYGQLAPEEQPVWVKAWYFATGYFVEAVLVFFVLSGFLVGGMAWARLRARNFDARGYAIDRFSRLYTAYLPALLLTVALTTIGMTWFNQTGLYDASNATFADKATIIDYGANSGIGPFLGNLFMLQTYFAQPYGSNPPLWTLSSEFWFYACFGLVGAALMRRGHARWLLAATGVTAALLLGPMFWLYLGMWLVGTAAAVIRPPRRNLVPPALLLLAGLLVARRFGDALLEPTDAMRFSFQFLICLATGMLLLAWRGRPPDWAAKFKRFNRFMADFSYSLYLTHFPVIVLAVAVLGRWTGDPGFATGFSPTEPLALATYGGTIALAFIFAWLFAQATERNTGKVRRRLKQRLLRAAPGLEHQHRP